MKKIDNAADYEEERARLSWNGKANAVPFWLILGGALSAVGSATALVYEKFISKKPSYALPLIALAASGVAIFVGDRKGRANNQELLELEKAKDEFLNGSDLPAEEKTARAAQWEGQKDTWRSTRRASADYQEWIQKTERENDSKNNGR